MQCSVVLSSAVQYLVVLCSAVQCSVPYPSQLHQRHNTSFISQGRQLQPTGQGNSTDAGSVVGALQNALEARRLLPSMVFSQALAIQIHTAHFLLLLAELVHSGLALPVPHHQHTCQKIHLRGQAVAVRIAQGLRGFWVKTLSLVSTDGLELSVELGDYSRRLRL